MPALSTDSELADALAAATSTTIGHDGQSDSERPPARPMPVLAPCLPAPRLSGTPAARSHRDHPPQFARRSRGPDSMPSCGTSNSGGERYRPQSQTSAAGPSTACPHLGRMRVRHFPYLTCTPWRGIVNCCRLALPRMTTLSCSVRARLAFQVDVPRPTRSRRASAGDDEASPVSKSHANVDEGRNEAEYLARLRTATPLCGGEARGDSSVAAVVRQPGSALTRRAFLLAACGGLWRWRSATDWRARARLRQATDSGRSGPTTWSRSPAAPGSHCDRRRSTTRVLRSA